MGKAIWAILASAALFVIVPPARALTIAQQSNQAVRDGSPVYACVDVAYGKMTNGTSVGAFPCHNGINQKWIYSNGQFLGIGSNESAVGGTNKCLSVAGNSSASGALVELHTCESGNTSQLWQATGNGSQSIIVNIGSGKCLDSQGQIGSNLHLIINTCNGSAGQTWDLR
jgi:hypothetical protein